MKLVRIIDPPNAAVRTKFAVTLTKEERATLTGLPPGVPLCPFGTRLTVVVALAGAGPEYRPGTGGAGGPGRRPTGSGGQHGWNRLARGQAAGLVVDGGDAVPDNLPH